MVSYLIPRGCVPQGVLMAGVVVATLSFLGVALTPLVTTAPADMYIIPGRGTTQLNEMFVVEVMVSSRVPVNVFTGEVLFDPRIVRVESIDYNTSIADLWAELPWYENGEGSVNFSGGTTKQGGFVGTGSLIKITFRTIEKGTTVVRLDNTRILAHDGLGTDVALRTPLDAIFEVETQVTEATVAEPSVSTATLYVATPPPHTDVNGDGKQSLADVSMFIIHLFGDDARFDFNQDGYIDTKDLSILMGAK